MYALETPLAGWQPMGLLARHGPPPSAHVE